MVEGGYFRYLSWELGDWRVDARSKSHQVIRFPEYLCYNCRMGQGNRIELGFGNNIYCKCEGMARYLSTLDGPRYVIGPAVANPDMPEHANDKVRRYIEEQHRAHNSKRELAWRRHIDELSNLPPITEEEIARIERMEKIIYSG